ncbi:MAG: hypothetical protein WD690_05080 [Vicinamibacterales bacterium]
MLALAHGTARAQAPDAAGAVTAAARAHYNAGRSAEALALLQPVIVRPGEPARAALVAARALLERFRASTDPADLATAREHLRAIDASALPAGERRELVVGLGEALYLEDAFAASAELFEAALAPSGPASLSGDARERALDWWATALDRHAQLRPQAERRLVYARIAERMERESREFPSSTPAAYWLAAAARGAGELDRAWAAAVAAWVRASMMSDRGAALRADIDRLVQQALIPERSRALGLAPRDAELAVAGMQAEWELIKKNWTR